MATINYAVLAPSEPRTISGKLAPARCAVRHIYQNKLDADGCAHAYHNVLGLSAEVAEIQPPLAVVRRNDVWGALDRAAGTLHVFASCEEAAAHAAKTETTLIDLPLRMAMPAQHGIPQFAPVPRRP